ncbi:hypothetical protein LOTGIDRAFT_133472, partial [Lottia gigantea]
LKLASYYGDDMVLQRGPQRAILWGTGSKIGDKVTVEIKGGDRRLQVWTRIIRNKEAEEIIWKIKLPPIKDTFTFNISISSSEGQLLIRDVLFGDVWICSGQSNMDFAMNSIFNSSLELVKSLTFKNIRVLRIGKDESLQPLEDVNIIKTKWSLPTSYSIPSFSAVCWLYAQYIFPSLLYPIGLIQSSTDSSSIEAWSSSEAITKCPESNSDSVRESLLWNAMIHPLLDTTIYGVLWYQGERNALHLSSNVPNYSCQFQALIEDWRSKFHTHSNGETKKDFPFGFVQLASYENDPDIIGTFPDLRWSQTSEQGKVPNADMHKTFMAVAMDLPDFNSPSGAIHPRDKQDVGLRLTLSGRAVAYNDKHVEYEGPFPSKYTKDSRTRGIEITYNNGKMPIEVRSEVGFEVVCCNENTIRCTNDTEWKAAPIETKTNTSVAISYDVCMGIAPSGIRYAWRESPCDFKLCPIYGAETGLPAPPFIKLSRF